MLPPSPHCCPIPFTVGDLVNGKVLGGDAAFEAQAFRRALSQAVGPHDTVPVQGQENNVVVVATKSLPGAS